MPVDSPPRFFTRRELHVQPCIEIETPELKSTGQAKSWKILVLYWFLSSSPSSLLSLAVEMERNIVESNIEAVKRTWVIGCIYGVDANSCIICQFAPATSVESFRYRSETA